MALIGNCSQTTYTPHPTNLVTETATHPDGTVKVLQVPEQVATVTNYTDIYLSIKQVEIFTFFENNIKYLVVNYQYAAYADVATRNNNQEDFLFWQTGQLATHDHETNLYAQIYTEINTIEGLTDLTAI